MPVINADFAPTIAEVREFESGASTAVAGSKIVIILKGVAGHYALPHPDVNAINVPVWEFFGLWDIARDSARPPGLVSTVEYVGQADTVGPDDEPSAWKYPLVGMGEVRVIAERGAFSPFEWDF